MSLGWVFFPFPERSGQTGLACDGVGGKAILPEEEEMPSCPPITSIEKAELRPQDWLKTIHSGL